MDASVRCRPVGSSALPAPPRCPTHEGGRQAPIDRVRLNEAGLDKCDRPGKVTDVIRCTGLNGIDGRFCKAREGAKLRTVRDSDGL